MSNDSQDLVVVRKFASTNEALIVKGLLDSNNIDTELVNENMSDLFPGSPMEEFQAKIVARAEDVDKINEILSAKFKESDLNNDFK